MYCRLEAGCGRTVLQYNPLCCNRLAWLRDIVSQYTWVYCDQGQGSWARWGAGQALGERGARRRACVGVLGRAASAGACGRALGARADARASGSRCGRARSVRGRAGWAAGARPGRWARLLALGSALGALGLFSIRFDSFFFFLSH